VVDITNEVLDGLQTTLGTTPILTAFPSTTPVFPCVIFSEVLNSTDVGTVDTSGETHSNVAFEIEIFSNGNDRMTVAKGIRNTIDGVMTGTYRMTRDTSEPIPNFLDTTIYRYILRYSFKIDTNKKIYRG